MKKAYFIAAIGMVAALSFGQIGPINAPIRSLTQILGSPANRGIDKEVWISLRTDGKSGAGTAEDPFDGSSAVKHDAVMRGLGPNATINYKPDLQISVGTVGITNGQARVIASTGTDWTNVSSEGSFLSLSDDPYQYSIQTVTAPGSSVSGKWEVTVSPVITESTNATSAYSIKRGFATNGSQDYTPNKGFIPKKNWNIIGAGRGISTLTLMSLNDVASGSKYEGLVIGDLDAATDESNGLIADLTINSNAQNLSAGTVGGTNYRVHGAWWHGDNCTIRNVEAINGRGRNSAGLEAFILAIGKLTGGGPAKNARIEGCLVRQPAIGSDYGAAISLSGVDGGLITKNVVRDWGGTCAYGWLGSNLVLDDNQAIDCILFFYSELNNGDGSQAWANYVIRNNTALVGPGHPAAHIAAGGGFVSIINLASPDTRGLAGLTIDNNTIVLKPTSTIGDSIGLALVLSSSAPITGVTLKNNHLIIDPRTTSQSSRSYRRWAISNIGGLSIEGNTFQDSTISAATSDIGSLSTSVSMKQGQNERQSVLINSLRLQATLGSGGGGATVYWNIPATYTIASGDHLQYEVYCDETNPRVEIYTNWNGGPGVNTLRDQNRLLGYDEITNFARGRWYFRDFDLTTIAGTATTRLDVALARGLPDGSLLDLGTYTAYLRNVQIVGADGVPKVRYYTAETSGTIGFTSQVNASAYSAASNAFAVPDNSVTTAKLANNAATNAKAAQMPVNTIKGNNNPDAAANPTDISTTAAFFAFMATPNSDNLRALLGDQKGTGADIFNFASDVQLSFVQTGLVVKGATNVPLTIKPNETLTAPRTLNIVTGDADRTVTLSGSPTLNDWFDQSVKTGASPSLAGLTVPQIAGSVAALGNLTLKSTTHGSKGRIYFGALNNDYYDELSNYWTFNDVIYFAGTNIFRGAIQDDIHAYLTINGGTSSQTYINNRLSIGTTTDPGSNNLAVAGSVSIGGGTAIAKVMSATATLDFASTVAGATTDLTMTVTGAVTGDVVAIGVPNGSVPAGGAFFGWVSAADTITVRYIDNSLVTGYDPASGTFRATVTHF